jgi:hypothetical protein
MNYTNDMSEYIESRDSAFTRRTISELESIELPELLKSRTPFWYQSQTEGSAGHLIIKVIDAKLAASDEAFARSALAELATAKSREYRGEVLKALGLRAKTRRRATHTACAHAANRLTRDFFNAFCTKTCAIDWVKLVSFVDEQAA